MSVWELMSNLRSFEGSARWRAHSFVLHWRIFRISAVAGTHLCNTFDAHVFLLYLHIVVIILIWSSTEFAYFFLCMLPVVSIASMYVNTAKTHLFSRDFLLYLFCIISRYDDVDDNALKYCWWRVPTLEGFYGVMLFGIDFESFWIDFVRSLCWDNIPVRSRPYLAIKQLSGTRPRKREEREKMKAKTV